MPAIGARAANPDRRAGENPAAKVVRGIGFTGSAPTDEAPNYAAETVRYPLSGVVRANPAEATARPARGRRAPKSDSYRGCCASGAVVA